MSQTSALTSTRTLLLSLMSSGFVVAIGGATSALLCGSAARSISWLGVGWSVVGPWLATALSLLPGRDAQPPLSRLPALSLFASLCGLLPLPDLHDGLLAVTLLAYAVVIIAGVHRRYTLRLGASLACGAGLAALHIFAALC